jgi:hypothetical protein
VSRDEIGRLLNDLSSAHHLWRPDPEHHLLSLGTENLAIDVTSDFIVRINVQPPSERAASVAAEAALLGRLQPITDIEVPDLPVAEQVSGLMIYRRLPGQPYLAAPHTDPAHEIAAIYRDLAPDVAFAVARAAEITDPGLMQRAQFLARCKWIEDFAYAVANEPVRRQYLENAHRTFRHTFACT